MSKKTFPKDDLYTTPCQRIGRLVLGVRNIHTLHRIFLPPVIQDLDKRRTSISKRRIPLLPLTVFALIVVVPRRALLQEVTPNRRPVNNRLRPCLLRILHRLHRPDSAFLALGDNVRIMNRLLVSDMHEVWRKSCLHDLDEEAVGEVARAPCMQCLCAISPLLGYRLVVAAVDLDAGLVRPFVCELETSGVDEAVEFVFLAVGYDAVGGEVVNTFAFGIDERDVGTVEGR